MSGISGILNFDQIPVAEPQLGRMLDAMQSRGPQGKASYIDGNAGFGMTLHGAQIQAIQEPIPLVHPERGWVLVLDGRIDNRADLLGTLNFQLKPSHGTGDGQIVLSAYEKWGERCPEYLLGDYAFAIWDPKKRNLFCARDHFGIKPFYYYASDRFFLFASNPEAILTALPTKPEINEGRIADHLLGLEGYDRTSTFYNNLYRLPHGHSLRVNSGCLRMDRYWELRPSDYGELKTEAAYLGAFQSLFTEAVECRLQEPTMAAVSLSGGLDSSAIFGVARKRSEQDFIGSLNTLAFVSPLDTKNPETGFIQMLLNLGGIQANTLTLTDLSGEMDIILQLLETSGEPFDWHMNFWRGLYHQAQLQNFHAVLDGADGDLLLSETGLARILWQTGQVQAALGETLLAEGLNTYYGSPWTLFIQSLRAAFLPGWLRRIGRKINETRAYPKGIDSSLIHPEFAQAIHLEDRLSKYRSYNVPPDAFPQSEAHRMAFIHPHLQAALERYDRVSSACSIEARHPLLDVRLVEFCLGLPWQLKTKRGWTKMAMRRMMEPMLPPEIVWRKDKHHLGWSANLVVLKCLKDTFRQILDDSSQTLSAYIDLNKMNRCWDQFFSSGNDDAASLVWDAIGLTLWLRRQR